MYVSEFIVFKKYRKIMVYLKNSVTKMVTLLGSRRIESLLYALPKANIMGKRIKCKNKIMKRQRIYRLIYLTALSLPNKKNTINSRKTLKIMKKRIKI